jgi:hypothetical protein
MSKILRKIPIIGSILRKLSMRKKKNRDEDDTWYPLY